MVPDDHGVILFRFGEKRWIEKIADGNLSFSCAGAFINQAKKTGNIVQGDEYEGIFARLYPDDSRIDNMKKRLGNDLEEINQNGYVLLRRKSAKLKPIYCFYGYTARDVLEDANIEQLGENVIRHEFDERMFGGFSNSEDVKNVLSEDRRFTMISLQPKPFVDRVRFFMAHNGYGFKMGKVNYELLSDDTFFIEPTSEYNELFYKSPEYSYQYEARICMKDMRFHNIFERFDLDIGKLKSEEYRINYDKLYFVINAVIARRK